MDKLKRLLWMLAIPAMVILLPACGDDEGEPDPAIDLYGIWESKSFTYIFTVNGDDIFVYLVDELGMSQAEAQEFVNDIVDDLSQGFSGTLEFRTDKTYTAEFGGDDPENGTWTLSEDKTLLTLTDEDSDSNEIDIVTLNATTLTAGFEETFEGIDEDGSPITVEMEIDLTFEKQ